MMFAPPSIFGLITLRVVASVLVLWLAGVGCIIGCEIKASAAHEEEVQVASEGESCPVSSSRHDCCRKEDADGTANVETPKHVAHISCCPLAVVSAVDPARKVGTKDVPVAVAVRGLHAVPDSRISTPLPSNRLRVPDRGGTHLRCCVFLI